MHLLSQAEAHTVLEPHLNNLSAPIYAAWKAWERQPPEWRRPLTPRTRANWLYDMTVASAKAMLDRPPIYSLTEQPGFLVVTVEDRIAIRYKKLDEELGICGVSTGQYRLWNEQVMPLDGLEELTYLVMGYQVSELGRMEGSARLVCSRNHTVLWDIEAPRAPQVGDVAPFPAPETPPAPVVAPKRAATEDGFAEGGEAR